MPIVRPRRSARALAAAAIGCAVALAAATPASAGIEITYPTETSLRAQTTAGDPVAVDCLAGRVLVNLEPTAAGCAALEDLEVLGDALTNRVDLSQVGAAFPNLTHRSVAGHGGADSLIGSPGRDWLRGGLGDDRVHGGDGDDRVDWYAGEGNDVVAGGSGTDAFTFFGGGGPDVAAVVADGPRLRLETRSGSPATVDLGTAIEKLSLLGLGGDDVLRGGDMSTFIDGHQGDDTIVGGEGTEDLRGGPGDDDLAGGGGEDVILAGEGDDTLRWNAGDGDDVLRGGLGSDTVLALGSRGEDTWSLKPSGVQSVQLQATPSGFTADLVEHLEADAGPGDDVVTASTGLAGRITLSQFGGAGDDVLTGGDGDDAQDGGPGLDLLNGSAGDDTLHAGDGVRDRVQCDTGVDLAYADPFDIVGDCETVKLTTR